MLLLLLLYVPLFVVAMEAVVVVVIAFVVLDVSSNEKNCGEDGVGGELVVLLFLSLVSRGRRRSSGC